MNHADILDAAADLIQFEGHWQGPPVDDERVTHCAHTAATVAAATPDDAIEASVALGRYLGLPVTLDGLSAVFLWNDTTPTDEVIDAMRRCAKALREVVA